MYTCIYAVPTNALKKELQHKKTFAAFSFSSGFTDLLITSFAIYPLSLAFTFKFRSLTIEAVTYIVFFLNRSLIDSKLFLNGKMHI